jgi:DNA-binding PadR family transcriptional regulator
MRTEILKGHLETMLLAVLAESPGHGYAVIEWLRSRSGGQFDLPEGTVYPALHRLERGGLIESEWDAGSGRKRRVYRLTQDGRKALAEQVKEFRSFMGGMTAVLGVSA